MNEEIAQFIKENESLIQGKRWEEIYEKEFPDGFTETLLGCGINPLEQGLNYIPKYFLYESNIKEFTIPDSVINIDYYAFAYCSSLTSVVIGNSIKSIATGAFRFCDSLTSVIIGNSLTSIGERVFLKCKKLTSITYLGTKKEAMQLGIGDRSKEIWRQGSIIKKIICVDGEIIL